MSYRQDFSEKELRILQERAARVRHPVENKRATNAGELVYIWLEQEVYAMPMMNLITVHKDVTVVPVPCVPAFISGVANIRGRVVPVIDLGRLLDVSAAPTSGAQKSEGHILVVAGAESQEVVFRVNRIGDAETTSETSLKSLPDRVDIPHPEFIAGLLPDGTPQLDVLAILNSPALVVNDSFDITNR